ncbi:Lysosomal aspartic protease-like Protein [Tribolium castaneum]|uniref:Lysosomal aspartic protease-like Protein n=1 Tax=Tribolium castaneum TaxID=7070 RepID=A0A139WEN4_TRICA|nr:Lysosomal aspartic protease-like Protein [Tribolium castaneum]
MMSHCYLVTTFILLVLAKYGVADKKHTFSFEIRRQKTPTEQYINHGHHFGRKFQEVIEGPGPRDNDSIALYRFLDVS